VPQDLSANHLSAVPPAKAWAALPFLSMLRLDNNRIASFDDFAGLGGAHCLRVLTLEGNPVDPTSPETAPAIMGAVASGRSPPGHSRRASAVGLPGRTSRRGSTDTGAPGEHRRQSVAGGFVGHTAPRRPPSRPGSSSGRSQGRGAGVAPQPAITGRKQGPGAATPARLPPAPGTHDGLARLFAAHKEYRLRALQLLPSSVVVLDHFLVVPAERPAGHPQSAESLRSGTSAAASQVLPELRATAGAEGAAMPFVVLDSDATGRRAEAVGGASAVPLSPHLRLPPAPPIRRTDPSFRLRAAAVQLQRAVDAYKATLGLVLPPTAGPPATYLVPLAAQDGVLVALAAAVAHVAPLVPLCLGFGPAEQRVDDPEPLLVSLQGAGITNSLLDEHAARLKAGGRRAAGRRRSLTEQLADVAAGARGSQAALVPQAARALAVASSGILGRTAATSSSLVTPETAGGRANAVAALLGLRFLDGPDGSVPSFELLQPADALLVTSQQAFPPDLRVRPDETDAQAHVRVLAKLSRRLAATPAAGAGLGAAAGASLAVSGFSSKWRKASLSGPGGASSSRAKAAGRTGHQRVEHESRVLGAVQSIQCGVRLFLWRRKVRGRLDRWLREDVALDSAGGVDGVLGGSRKGMAESYWARQEHWAAKLVQKYWRAKVVVIRRVRGAATVQRAWRCYVARVRCLARAIEMAWRECGEGWRESDRRGGWGEPRPRPEDGDSPRRRMSSPASPLRLAAEGAGGPPFQSGPEPYGGADDASLLGSSSDEGGPGIGTLAGRRAAARARQASAMPPAAGSGSAAARASRRREAAHRAPAAKPGPGKGRRVASPGFDFLVPGTPAILAALERAAAEAILVQGGLSAATVRPAAWQWKREVRRQESRPLRAAPSAMGARAAPVRLGITATAGPVTVQGPPGRQMRPVSGISAGTAGGDTVDTGGAGGQAARPEPSLLREEACSAMDGWWRPVLAFSEGGAPIEDLGTAVEAVRESGAVGPTAYAPIVWPGRVRSVRHAWVRQGDGIIAYKQKERAEAILRHKQSVRQGVRAKRVRQRERRRVAQEALAGGRLSRKLLAQMKREMLGLRARWAEEDAEDRAAAAELAVVMVNPLHFRRRRGGMQLACDGVIRRLPSVAEALARRRRRAERRAARLREATADGLSVFTAGGGDAGAEEDDILTPSLASAGATPLPGGRWAVPHLPIPPHGGGDPTAAAAGAAGRGSHPPPPLHAMPLVAGGLPRVRGAHRWFGLTTALGRKLALLGNRAGAPSSRIVGIYRREFARAARAARVLASGADAPGCEGGRVLHRVVMPTPLLLARTIHRLRWHLQRRGVLPAPRGAAVLAGSKAGRELAPSAASDGAITSVRATGRTPFSVSSVRAGSAGPPGRAVLPPPGGSARPVALLTRAVIRLSHAGALGGERPEPASLLVHQMRQLRASADDARRAGPGRHVASASSASTGSGASASRSRHRRRSSITVALESPVPRWHRWLCVGGPPAVGLFGWQAAQLAAAVTIQSAWRSVSARLSLRPVAPHRLLERRAVVCVQRAVRARQFRRRLGLLRAVRRLAIEVLADNSPTLFIEVPTVEALARGMAGSGQGPHGGGVEERTWLAARSPWARHPLPEHLLEIAFRRVGGRGKASAAAGGRRDSASRGLFLRREFGTGDAAGRAGPAEEDKEDEASSDGADSGGGGPPDAGADSPDAGTDVHEAEARGRRGGGGRGDRYALGVATPPTLPAAWADRRVGLPDWLGWSTRWLDGGGSVTRRINTRRGESSWSSPLIPPASPSARAFGYPVTAVPALCVDAGIEVVRHGFRHVRGAGPHPELWSVMNVRPERAAASRLGHGPRRFTSTRGQELESVDVPEWHSRGVPLLAVTFSSVTEARSRACVLLATTWSSPLGAGAKMWTATQLWQAWAAVAADGSEAAKAAAAPPLTSSKNDATPPSQWALACAAAWPRARDVVLGRQPVGVGPGTGGGGAAGAAGGRARRPHRPLPADQARLTEAASRWASGSAAAAGSGGARGSGPRVRLGGSGPGAAWRLPPATPLRAFTARGAAPSDVSLARLGRVAVTSSGGDGVFRPMATLDARKAREATEMWGRDGGGIEWPSGAAGGRPGTAASGAAGAQRHRAPRKQSDRGASASAGRHPAPGAEARSTLRSSAGRGRPGPASPVRSGTSSGRRTAPLRQAPGVRYESSKSLTAVGPWGEPGEPGGPATAVVAVTGEGSGRPGRAAAAGGAGATAPMPFRGASAEQERRERVAVARTQRAAATRAARADAEHRAEQARQQEQADRAALEDGMASTAAKHAARTAGAHKRVHRAKSRVDARAGSMGEAQAFARRANAEVRRRQRESGTHKA